MPVRAAGNGSADHRAHTSQAAATAIPTEPENAEQLKAIGQGLSAGPYVGKLGLGVWRTGQ
jgi:hypothetical protein